MTKLFSKLVLSFIFLTTILAIAAPTPTKIVSDTVIMGNGTTSPSTKSFKFNFGLLSDPTFEYDNTNSRFSLNKNTVKIGDAAGSNKVILFDVGLGASNPQIRWNNSTTTLQFSNDGSGFTNIGSGGSGGGVGIDFLEVQNKLDRFPIKTDTVEGTLRDGFGVAEIQNDLWLLEDAAASGTTIVAVSNPQFISSADKNMDVTTGFTAGGAGVNLTTSATNKVGAASISVDKDNSATVAYIGGDFSQNVGTNSRVFGWVNMPSVTGLTNIFVELCSDTGATNCSKFATTTVHGGGAIASGWNLLEISVGGTPTSTTGTPWTTAQVARTTRIGVTTSSAGQTYSAILIDGFVFAPDDNSLLVQLGDEYTLYDASNAESIILATSNTVTQGSLTLASALVDNYQAGTASFIKRSPSENLGKGIVTFPLTATGDIDLTQTIRRKTMLRASVSSQAYNVSVVESTPLFFEVNQVDSTTQIKVKDSQNYSANMLNGDKYYVFRTDKVNGKKQYAYRNLVVTLNANSSHSSGLLTLQNSGTNSGVVAGDTIVKGNIDTFVSLVASGSAESYGSALSESDFLVEDIGFPYPQPDKVIAHYPLGGTNGLLNKKGVWPALSEVGGPANKFNDFFDGLFGIGPFNTGGASTHYLQLPGGDGASLLLAGDGAAGHGTFSMSYWVYLASACGSGCYSISNSTTNPGGNSWHDSINPSNQLVFSTSNSTVHTTSAVLTFGTWHHRVVTHQDGTPAISYLDGVKTTGAGNTAHDYSADAWFTIGDLRALGTPGPVRFADLVIWEGVRISDSDVANIYNSGKHILVGDNPGFKHRYTTNPLTGQKLTVKVNQKRKTNAVGVNIHQISVQKQ